MNSVVYYDYLKRNYRETHLEGNTLDHCLVIHP